MDKFSGLDSKLGFQQISFAMETCSSKISEKKKSFINILKILNKRKLLKILKQLKKKKVFFSKNIDMIEA